MWIESKVHCDVCGAEAFCYARVANIIIAELCAEHWKPIAAKIRAELKSDPTWTAGLDGIITSGENAPIGKTVSDIFSEPMADTVRLVSTPGQGMPPV